MGARSQGDNDDNKAIAGIIFPLPQRSTAFTPGYCQSAKGLEIERCEETEVEIDREYPTGG